MDAELAAARAAQAQRWAAAQAAEGEVRPSRARSVLRLLLARC